jgi:hypothetical protein
MFFERNRGRVKGRAAQPLAFMGGSCLKAGNMPD